MSTTQNNLKTRGRQNLIGLDWIERDRIGSTFFDPIQSDQVFETPQSDQVNPIKFYFRVNPIKFFLRLNPIRFFQVGLPTPA
jgi:hypothetical protein